MCMWGGGQEIEGEIWKIVPEAYNHRHILTLTKSDQTVTQDTLNYVHSLPIDNYLGVCLGHFFPMSPME